MQTQVVTSTVTNQSIADNDYRLETRIPGKSYFHTFTTEPSKNPGRANLARALTIVQLSDTHITKNSATLANGVNPEQNLSRAIEYIKQLNPDFVILTGDVSEDGSQSSYEITNKLLSQLPCNTNAILGNHDDADNFSKYLIQGKVTHEALLTTDQGTFIFLDSHKSGSHAGYITEAGLNHLKNSLEHHERCIVVVHHHFLPIGGEFDEYMIENKEDFLAILREYEKKLEFVIVGHIHKARVASARHKDATMHEGVTTTMVAGIASSHQYQDTLKGFHRDEKIPGGVTVYTFHRMGVEIRDEYLTAETEKTPIDLDQELAETSL